MLLTYFIKLYHHWAVTQNKLECFAITLMIHFCYRRIYFIKLFHHFALNQNKLECFVVTSMKFFGIFAARAHVIKLFTAVSYNFS